MMSSVITAYEVIKYGPTRQNYPITFICNHIQRKEYVLFSKCYLGTGFRGKLIADLEAPAGVSDYNASTTYSIDDAVKYEGSVLISLTDNNNVNPDDDDGTNWRESRKFKSDIYQELWDTFMKYWLAFEIAHTSVKYSTYDIGAHGATKHKSETEESVNLKELMEIKKEIKDDAHDTLVVMYDWMKERNLLDGSFDFIKGSDCDYNECVEPKKRQKRTKYLR